MNAKMEKMARVAVKISQCTIAVAVIFFVGVIAYHLGCAWMKVFVF